MNGSEDNRPPCTMIGCHVEQGKAADNSYDHLKLSGGWYRDDWYCDVCLSILRGTEENARLRKKVKWAESLIRPGLLGRLFRRFFMRRAYVKRLEDGLSAILNHAGCAIECCDEPGAGYLRDVCKIVDDTFGIDTDREVAESDPV